MQKVMDSKAGKKELRLTTRKPVRAVRDTGRVDGKKPHRFDDRNPRAAAPATGENLDSLLIALTDLKLIPHRFRIFDAPRPGRFVLHGDGGRRGGGVTGGGVTGGRVPGAGTRVPA